MSDFQTVARVGEIPAGEGRAFTVNGKLVGVFHVDGEYFAINDLCPHMGASLSGGYVEDGKVMCPWHAWRFDVRDGTWCDNPKVKTEAYEVRVREDEIQVLVPEPLPRTGSEGSQPAT
jgi:nitrite reductase (NADH) small subunit